MKTTIKVLGGIIALGVVALVLLHVFLHYGLTKAMRTVVLPRIQEETGLDVRVGRLSLNIPRGELYLKEVALRNPEGYALENGASIDEIHVAVDVASLLLQKPILVHQVQLKNAQINVIRNQQKKINLKELQDQLPKRATPPAEPAPDEPVRPEKPTAPAERKPIPELVIQELFCSARVRYLDERHAEHDYALDLSAQGRELSTLRTADAAWGRLNISGALSNDETSFKTDLDLKLSPITDPQTLSFDLSGEVLKIDPAIMQDLCDKLRIRCAPFALNPELYCRSGRFERSSVALELRQVEFKEKLARELGGVAAIGTLRLAVPVTGSLQQPKADLTSAFMSAMGDNAGTVFNSLIRGVVGHELGTDAAPTNLVDAAVEVLGKHVKEIGESETAQTILKELAGGSPAATNASKTDVLVDLLGEQVKEIGESETAKKILKDLAGGASSDTNAPAPPKTDVLIDLLGEQVDELGADEELKESLKGLGRALFGK